MSKLLTAKTDDAESAEVEATGPVLVTVTGTMPTGMVVITGDIGGGEAVAYTHASVDATSFARLEFTTGVTFKAYLIGVDGASGVLVDVDYIFT